MSYRLIVCFDIEAHSLEGAYAQLESRLRHIPIPWETSDEAYDEDGEEIDPDVLQKAIVSVLRSLDHHDEQPERLGLPSGARIVADPIPAESALDILREGEVLLDGIDEVSFGEMTPTINSILACMRDAMSILEKDRELFLPCANRFVHLDHHDEPTLEFWRTTALDLYDQVGPSDRADVLSEKQQRMLDAARRQRDEEDD